MLIERKGHWNRNLSLPGSHVYLEKSGTSPDSVLRTKRCTTLGYFRQLHRILVSYETHIFGFM